MSEHFGLSPIKRWLDSGEWINNIPDFHQLLPHDQDELVDAMNQAAMGTFTRNWMEIKKLFYYIFITVLLLHIIWPIVYLQEMSINTMLEIYLIFF